MNDGYFVMNKNTESTSVWLQADENKSADENIAYCIDHFLRRSGNRDGSIPEVLELLELFERLEGQNA